MPNSQVDVFLVVYNKRNMHELLPVWHLVHQEGKWVLCGRCDTL
jgi:hypothetical protein